MGIVRKGIAPAHASDIVREGVSTDKERTDLMAAHITEYHTAGSSAAEALPYYYDEARELYLSQQVFKIPFYLNGIVKKQYMNYMPDIRSSSVPYRLISDNLFCLVGFEFYMATETSGLLMEVRDENSNYASILSISTSTLVNQVFNNEVNITLPLDTGLCVFAEDNSLNDPVLILSTRRIYDIGV